MLPNGEEEEAEENGEKQINEHPKRNVNHIGHSSAQIINDL